MSDNPLVLSARPDSRSARHRAGPPRPARQRREPMPLVLTALIVAGALPVAFVWWQNTIPGSLDSPAADLTAAGRIAGLLAAYLLLVLVALMARVPLLENRIGSDTVARLHRALGEYTVALAFAHAALIVCGYAWQGRTDPLTETWAVVTGYTDVWLAAVALGLLGLIGVVSARAVRRRVAYESWYHVHLLAYAATALAFSHEFAVGTEFSASPRNRLLWSAAHVVVGAAVVVFRLALPLYRSLRHGVRVAAVVAEGPGVVSVHLTGRDLDRLGARAGQFLRWRFLARGQWWQSHPYSLSAAPTPDALRITVKALGDASGALARLRPGTRVWFEGPYGAFTARRATFTARGTFTARQTFTARWRRGTARPVLLLAAGAGVTPLRALYETLPARARGGPGHHDGGAHHDGGVLLVQRASRDEDLVLHAELRRIAQARGFGLLAVVGPRGGPSGDPLRADRLRAMVPGLAEHDVYLCGPAGWTAFVRAELRRAGVPARRIRTEAFAF
ncbi:ferredoxin reductase family protein [Streptomyces sp. PTM05]|uniref:Ferredoxin reductase family protein n=1 Tax=Streptantibioticus parmotrematis TaxID=2873249 RepID=A0ABS7QUL0_9ACTN|nr:ferredoxin reductase family protein [Streptantibioticus parmotrematis]MBY8886896.1 ferredoxin reductase family protein [Streptantibioticus parmotrematis]